MVRSDWGAVMWRPACEPFEPSRKLCRAEPRVNFQELFTHKPSQAWLEISRASSRVGSARSHPYSSRNSSRTTTTAPRPLLPSTPTRAVAAALGIVALHLPIHRHRATAPLRPTAPGPCTTAVQPEWRPPQGQEEEGQRRPCSTWRCTNRSHAIQPVDGVHLHVPHGHGHPRTASRRGISSSRGARLHGVPAGSGARPVRLLQHRCPV
jgi:hypothetical protein